MVLFLNHPIPLPASPLKGEEQDENCLPLKGEEQNENSLPFKGRVRVGMGLAGNLTYVEVD